LTASNKIAEIHKLLPEGVRIVPTLRSQPAHPRAIDTSGKSSLRRAWWWPSLHSFSCGTSAPHWCHHHLPIAIIFVPAHVWAGLTSKHHVAVHRHAIGAMVALPSSWGKCPQGTDIFVKNMGASRRGRNRGRHHRSSQSVATPVLLLLVITVSFIPSFR